MSKLQELTEEQKQKIVDEVNAETEEPKSEGNTSLFTLDDISEEAGQGSAQAQYQKSVAVNAQVLYSLHQILNSKSGIGGHKISRANLVKLVIATLKLPEEGAHLKFNGSPEQQQMCEFAFGQMQLAANTRAFVMGVDAMRQQRRAMKEQEEANKETQEIKEKDNE